MQAAILPLQAHQKFQPNPREDNSWDAFWGGPLNLQTPKPGIMPPLEIHLTQLHHILFFFHYIKKSATVTMAVVNNLIHITQIYFSVQAD